MTPARLHALEQSLNGYARKVLDAMPISEPWTIVQIMSEMRRVGSSVDPRVLQGCMTTLLDNGLIRSVNGRGFIRTTARQPSFVPSIVAPTPTEPSMPEPDPIKKLENIVAQLKALSSEVETIAIEITEQAQKNTEENKKLLQLKNLLKDLS